MTLTSAILWRRRAGDLFERDRLVEARLGRQTEHPFADDVALDLVGAAADGDGRSGEEEGEPVVLPHQAADAAQVHGEVGEALHRRRAPQLGARALGARGTAGGPG